MNTLTLTCVTHKRERERAVAGEGGGSVFGFYLLSFGASILRKLLLGFFPLGFSQDKSLCSFCVVVLVYLSLIFWLMVMQL